MIKTWTLFSLSKSSQYVSKHKPNPITYKIKLRHFSVVALRALPPRSGERALPLEPLLTPIPHCSPLMQYSHLTVLGPSASLPFVHAQTMRSLLLDLVKTLLTLQSSAPRPLLFEVRCTMHSGLLIFLAMISQC